MQFVHGYRCETALKQMPRPAAPCIDEIGLAAMCFAHGTAEPIGLWRIQDQVHVVWHQAVSPDFHIRLARLFPKKIAVNLLIAVFKENRFLDDCHAASRDAGDPIPPRVPKAS